MSEDFVKRGHNLNQAFRLALCDIARKTGEFGMHYSTFKSMPTLDAAEIDADAVAIDRETARTEAEQAYTTLNDEQREAANAILNSLKIPIPAGDLITGAEKGFIIHIIFLS